MKVAVVVGARPNFMKAAPVLRALEQEPDCKVELVHTGQHYDRNMSDSFLEDLELPAPDLMLGVGSGTHARQTADVMARLEEHLLRHRRDFVVVVGDVNSTLGAALAAVKLLIPVGHVESGLRSFDRRMPEEINRRATDAIASLLFVTEPSGVLNLRREGVDESRIRHVGNTMIDSLLRFRAAAEARPLPADLPDGFGVITLHRPSNVDDKATLSGILDAFEAIAAKRALCWPLHPRARKQLLSFGLYGRVERSHGLRVVPPAGYLDFLALLSRASLVLTDSGGIQEEALVLGVPVVTLRENTERPVTVEGGGNVLSGSDPARILAAAEEMLGKDARSFVVPRLWDGRAGERIARDIVSFVREGGGL